MDEAYIKAYNLWNSEIGQCVTDDREKYEADTSGELIYVPDRSPIIDAVANELLDDTYGTRDEDICGFLTRHGIVWE